MRGKESKSGGRKREKEKDAEKEGRRENVS